MTPAETDSGDFANCFSGIDKEPQAEGLTEFDIEIRRRLWTLLFIWDWYVRELDVQLEAHCV